MDCFKDPTEIFYIIKNHKLKYLDLSANFMHWTLMGRKNEVCPNSYYTV